jgi:hypothetical protein
VTTPDYQPLERRYQVFVSSTFKDLVPERQEVIQALLELDCIPAGMELFPASDDDRWTLIRKVIDDCDYYIVIVAGRYGSVDSEGVSYTEREYDYAVETGKPVMGFVHAEPGAIAVGKSDTNAEAMQKLNAFREKVENRMCKRWTTAEELGGAVSRSLIKMIKDRPSAGWVRGDQVLTPQVQGELTSLRARIAELEAQRRVPTGMRADLARGSDEFTLHYTYKREGSSVAAKPLKGEVAFSWDGMFGVFGPLMLDELSEDQFRAYVTNAVTNSARRQKAPTKITDIVVQRGDITQVLLQFLALGLIDKSGRRRSADDRGADWILTESGRQYLMNLRAIKRPSQATDDETTPRP